MIGWDYGYRSRCCYAPIKLGRRKVKNSALKIQVWVCTKCKKRDVPIIEYSKGRPLQTTEEIKETTSFIPEDE